MNISKRFMSIGAIVGVLALGASLAGAQAPAFLELVRAGLLEPTIRSGD